MAPSGVGRRKINTRVERSTYNNSITYEKSARQERVERIKRVCACYTPTAVTIRIQFNTANNSGNTKTTKRDDGAAR